MNKIAPLHEPLVDDMRARESPSVDEKTWTPSRPLHRDSPKLAARVASPSPPYAGRRPVSRWWAESHDYEWLLLLRFALANAFALALLAAAWAVGYINMVLVADTSHLSVAIAGVFVLGWLFACRAAVLISQDLNRVRRRDDEFPCEPTDNLKERLAGRIAVVRHTANTLVLLGLIGTVIGFIVALSGVKPGQAGDASAIGPMVSTLIHGMSIALYTTLVGSVFALWLTVLHRILATAASKLLCAARTAGYVR
jgi:hypothetical protein